MPHNGYRHLSKNKEVKETMADLINHYLSSSDTQEPQTMFIGCAWLELLVEVEQRGYQVMQFAVNFIFGIFYGTNGGKCGNNHYGG